MERVNSFHCGLLSSFNPTEDLLSNSMQLFALDQHSTTISNEETFLLRFSRDSEANASELRENLEEMFPPHTV